MSRYLGFFRNSLLVRVVYRGDYWLRLAGTAMAALIQYYLWRAVYGSATGPLGGLALAETLTYVIIAGVLGSFLQIEMDISRRIRDGSIAMSLARPADWQAMVWAESFGDSLFTLVAVSLPVYLVALALGLIAPPATLAHGLAFVAALLLGYMVLFSIGYLSSLATFWTKAGWGFIDFQAAIVAFFSGALIPLTMYPAWLQRVTAWLPFQGIFYQPLSIYLGKVTPDAIAGRLAGQAAWAVALVVAGRLLWRKAVAQVTVQGG